MENPYASIPQVGRLLEREEISRWFPVIGRPLVAVHVSAVLGELREAFARGEAPPSAAEVVARIEDVCRRTGMRRIRKVLNGTGIVLHTNMGRSPLEREAWDDVKLLNTGYSNIELDLDSGKRGRRSGLIPELIQALTGAESCLVVNNNAAAVLLMLSSLAAGREVIVSRGEQVQIGGGFRIPEILALSGARLVEVGTTNITTLRDYLDAVTENTAMILVVHTANFRLRGFTSKPSVNELARNLPGGVILAVDQGSGVTSEKIPGEIPVKRHLADGAHLVCFSGDKVMGGPQAGFLVGKEDLVRRASEHPMMRTFRPGKTIYSLLEEILIRKMNGPESGYPERIYAKSMEELRRFGRRILKGIPKETADIVPAMAATGGGSAPDEYFGSLAIEICADTRPGKILKSLRNLEIPIIGVVEEGKVHLNLSTLIGEDAAYIRTSLMAVLGIEAL